MRRVNESKPASACAAAPSTTRVVPLVATLGPALDIKGVLALIVEERDLVLAWRSATGNEQEAMLARFREIRDEIHELVAHVIEPLASHEVECDDAQAPAPT